MKPSHATQSNDLPRNQRLILDAFHLDPARLRAEDVAALRVEEWQDLRHLAEVHRLGPMLYERLGRQDLMDFIPAEILADFKEQFRRNSLRNLMLYRELADIARMLKQAGIACIALKGAYLAQFAYPRLGLRPLRDLDILVREDQAAQAFDLIRAKGYASDGRAAVEAHAELHKHLPALVNQRGARIELHVRLVMPEGHANGRELSFHAWDRLLERCVTRELGGVSVRFLCPGDLLLHLCVHASLEHRFNVGPLVLSDIACLLRTHAFDWQDFVAVTLSGGWREGVLPPLEMAHGHLGVDIPESVLAVLSAGQDSLEWRASADCLIFADPNETQALWGVYFAAAMFGSKSDRIYSREMLRRLFVPRQKVATEFSVSPESAAIYFYYPLRWCRQARTAIRAFWNCRHPASLNGLIRHQEKFDRWLKKTGEAAQG